MPGWHGTNRIHSMTEDDEDELEHDREAPDPSDVSDEPAEVRCPYCKREISEEALQCPYCGSYMSREDAPPSRKPWWWIAAVILLVVILLRYLWR